MTNDQTEYELFLSYARRDNQPIPATYPHGWVSALRDQIVADHRAHETSPLRIFLDTREIRDMDDWRNRILGALRRSKILLICLSPNYFQSDPCRWEWDEYQARQHHKLIGSDAHATVYFVEVPGTLEHDNARRLEAILGSNFTDLRPWFPTGAAALREEAVRQHLAALGLGIWERISRSRRALAVPGNVRSMTPYFVGRSRELAELHRLVGVGKVGLIGAVHGLGGQGKTELAIAYARSYADAYRLGLWQLAAESATELLPLIGQLGLDARFGYTPNEAEKADAEQLGLGVLLELGRRAEAARADDPDTAPAALLILDNVSEPALLSATQLSRLPAGADWLRIVATTRLTPQAIDPARKRLGAVEVDSLDPESALRLIEDHLPDGRFRTPADRADAREIVRELGGFTLAVEQVAVYLGLKEGETPGQYLAHLRANGLPSADDLSDGDVRSQIEHQTRLLRPILASMLAPLSDAGRTLLTFAALLPPERIPWPWLKTLTARHHPELLEETLPNPWMSLRRLVQGLRFLTGSIEDESARMHRLVAAHLRAEGDEDRDEELRGYLAERADAIYRQQDVPPDWELDGLLEAIPHLLNARPERRLAIDGIFLTDKLVAYRNLATAALLLKNTGAVIQVLADNDPQSAEKQRDLSISYERLGDVSVSSGDLKSARSYYEDGLRIRRNLADNDPQSAEKQRDLSISFNKLGDVSASSGDLKSARSYYEDGLRISRNLADNDPQSAEKQRDLSISFNKLGDVSVSSGDLKSARSYYEDGLRIRRNLADNDPQSAEKQRDLSISYERLGDVSVSSGDLKSARSYYEDGLRISRNLADNDPQSAEKQRDLSISFNKLGDVSVSSGDLKSARSYYEDGLRIRRNLADNDPQSAEKQRDLSISFNKLGDVSVSSGDLKSARSYYEDGLRISRNLADNDPQSAEKQRDLSISFNKLGDVSVSSGDLKSARSYYEDGLRISRDLADNDPQSAEKQRDLWVSHWKIASLLEKQERSAEALAHWQQAHDILQDMVTHGLHVSPQDLGFLERLRSKLTE